MATVSVRTEGARSGLLRRPTATTGFCHHTDDCVVNTVARESRVEAMMQRLLTGAASTRLAAAGPFACPALTEQPQR